jgi:hypothetical protein
VRAAHSSSDVPFTFAFHARTGAHPDGVYGTFSGSFPHDPLRQGGRPLFPAPGKFVTFKGLVTCLRVSGDTATIGALITSGRGYDGTYTTYQHDLAGDWFITTIHDPRHGRDTMGYTDWGDRAYFGDASNFHGHSFRTFRSLCDNPTPDLGHAQFRLASGDITVGS